VSWYSNDRRSLECSEPGGELPEDCGGMEEYDMRPLGFVSPLNKVVQTPQFNVHYPIEMTLGKVIDHDLTIFSSLQWIIHNA
jgi:hypothetical protein